MPAGSAWLERPLELLLQMTARRRLRDEQQLRRFRGLRGRYRSVVDRLATDRGRFRGSRYDWDSWSNQVATAFDTGVPVDFLSDAVISRTMVFGRRFGIAATHRRIERILEVLSPDDAAMILREDYVGLPTITSARFLTSANRAHHVRHLAEYRGATGTELWSSERVLEWGGGYGSFARLTKRMNPSITYTIVDLPALLGLQFVYLSSVLGEDAVVLLGDETRSIQQGKINLVTTSWALANPDRLAAETFVSTWALTECPPGIQETVQSHAFFRAKRVLIGAACDRNTFLRSDGLCRIPVRLRGEEDVQDEYWIQ